MSDLLRSVVIGVRVQRDESMLRVYCVYHEFRRTGMRGVDGMRAPMSPDVVFSSTALRAASPDGGLNELRHPRRAPGPTVRV